LIRPEKVWVTKERMTGISLKPGTSAPVGLGRVKDYALEKSRKFGNSILDAERRGKWVWGWRLSS